MTGSEARGGRPPSFEIAVEGASTPEEHAAVTAAVEALLESEERSTASSLWLRAARAQGRRLGMFDYRDRFSRDDAWRLSTRFAFGGREYQGRLGRADTR